ncbi:MAG: MGDG synthase family glycosyltransferase [Anaerolineae bacterium]
MTKKILILTADAGFGHRAAANAIAAALAERHPDVTVEIVNPLSRPDAPGLLKLAESDYDRQVRETPELYSLGYQVSDRSVAIGLIEQGLIALLYKPLKEVVESSRPDVIISTYPLYQAPLAAIFALGGPYIPVLVVVTDLATVHGLWFHDDVDLCLVPTEQARHKALASGLTGEQVVITGIPVNPFFARPPDRTALRERLGWRQDQVAVLVAGSKRVTRVEPIVQALNHSGLPLQLALVAGGNEALLAQWQAEEWHRPAYIYGYVANMPELICAADLIICKAGGLIVSEALAAGLPLLIVEAIPGQETGNAEVVVQAGAGELIPDALAALTAMCHWLERDRALLSERAANARRLGRPDAAYRVADLAYQAAQLGMPRREHRFLKQLGQLREIIKLPVSALRLDAWGRDLRDL